MSAPGFDWRALMQVGIGHLGMSPEVFWNLTPVELLLVAGIAPGSSLAMTRKELDALREKFPDLDRGEE
ncbi:MAG: phage tail assembly chaperone [Pseudomonadota bacterium]